ncbi:hypothetical protein GJ496_007708 [Pomphorhynchus laevis]|nr:hypothetical protein GJ496_007708 [Pomphorhynchus laevis]
MNNFYHEVRNAFDNENLQIPDLYLRALDSSGVLSIDVQTFLYKSMLRFKCTSNILLVVQIQKSIMDQIKLNDEKGMHCLNTLLDLDAQPLCLDAESESNVTEIGMRLLRFYYGVVSGTACETMEKSLTRLPSSSTKPVLTALQRIVHAQLMFALRKYKDAALKFLQILMEFNVSLNECLLSTALSSPDQDRACILFCLLAREDIPENIRPFLESLRHNVLIHCKTIVDFKEGYPEMSELVHNDLRLSIIRTNIVTVATRFFSATTIDHLCSLIGSNSSSETESLCIELIINNVLPRMSIDEPNKVVYFDCLNRNNEHLLSDVSEDIKTLCTKLCDLCEKIKTVDSDNGDENASGNKKRNVKLDVDESSDDDISIYVIEDVDDDVNTDSDEDKNEYDSLRRPELSIGTRQPSLSTKVKQQLTDFMELSAIPSSPPERQFINNNIKFDEHHYGKRVSAKFTNGDIRGAESLAALIAHHPPAPPNLLFPPPPDDTIIAASVRQDAGQTSNKTSLAQDNPEDRMGFDRDNCVAY